MLSPQKFAETTGLSYQQVLIMCKKGDVETVKTRGGHFKIYESEIDKFINNQDVITREDYERVLRENERLRTMLSQLKILLKDVS